MRGEPVPNGDVQSAAPRVRPLPQPHPENIVKLQTTLPLLMAAGLLVACGEKVDTGASDVDGDGLTYEEELEAVLGTDPTMADSDEDGLEDAEEADYGTDPLVADSDGDTYSDGDEVAAGTNPMYEYSHSYTGGYNVGYCENGVATPTGATGQGSYGSHSWDAYAVGDVVDNFSMMDQHGEYVDLYSFCGQVIVLAFGAFW